MNILKRLFVWFRQVPYSVFLVLFIISTAISIWALRQNNFTMIKLRNEVYAADKNNGDVNAALNKLRVYVYAHMNTNLASGGNAIKPPIQLPYTYERLVAAAEQQANNSGLYTEAENYCQAQIPASVSISGRGRIGCVQDSTYFGHIKAMNDKYIVLGDVYYLTTDQGQTTAQTTAGNPQLTKLGCQQLHAPTDQMVINRSQVAFWENLQDSGKVAQAIKQYIQQNPNGPNCNATSNTPSNSTQQNTGTQDNSTTTPSNSTTNKKTTP